jgi:hypothetical protein
VFDKGGTGLSHRTTGIADLETRMDDIHALMEAVGSRRGRHHGRVRGRADDPVVRGYLPGANGARHPLRLRRFIHPNGRLSLGAKRDRSRGPPTLSVEPWLPLD